MWNEGYRNQEDGEEAIGRTSTSSDVMVVNDMALDAVAGVPAVSNLNITRSSRVHIGPKFVSVTQNVSNTEVVKGSILGLELVSAKRSRRLRCSIAVFVCWAFLVASGLALYLIYVALPKYRSRLDLDIEDDWYLRRIDWQAMNEYELEFLELPVKYVIIGHTAGDACTDKYSCIEKVLGIQKDHLQRGWSDIGPNFLVGGNDGFVFEGRELPLPQYLWNIMRNTTRAEKVSCTVAMAALLLCTSLIIYFTAAANKSAIKVIDKAPHEWNITREMWLATAYNFTRIDEQYKPLKLVVVQHSVSTECHRFVLCAAELRTLEHYFLSLNSGLNLPYNFIIGNEARVYEAVGWDFIGTHTLGFNRCSLGVGFIGDYRLEKNLHTKVTTKQLERFQMLLDAGVEYGYLDPNYRIVGARDVTPTLSPGSGLYAALTAMDHFDSKHMFYGKTCDEIRDMHLPTINKT